MATVAKLLSKNRLHSIPNNPTPPKPTKPIDPPGEKLAHIVSDKNKTKLPNITKKVRMRQSCIIHFL